MFARVPCRYSHHLIIVLSARLKHHERTPADWWDMNGGPETRAGGRGEGKRSAEYKNCVFDRGYECE